MPNTSTKRLNLPGTNSLPFWMTVWPLLKKRIETRSCCDSSTTKATKKIAQGLGINAVAAKKRTSRAVERLRAFFTGRGVALPLPLLVAAVSAYSVQAAPAGIATIILAAVAQNSEAAASTASLVQGVLKIMAWTKAKLAVGAAAAAMILGVGT